MMILRTLQDKQSFLQFERQWPNKPYPKGSDLDDLIRDGGTLADVLDEVATSGYSCRC